MDDEKRKILKEIMTSDEDILIRLKKLVESSKSFLKVEEKSGKVIISSDFKFDNSEKIFLLLLGKFFAMHYGILKDYSVTFGDIRSELGIKRTTLSAPIKTLVDNGLIERPKENTYKINFYKAGYLLNKLREKYLSKKG
jgi:DNA-binding transcriptional ArsR family regulator